jgi:hypothetical protein
MLTATAIRSVAKDHRVSLSRFIYALASFQVESEGWQARQ